MGVDYALWAVQNRGTDVEAAVRFYGNGGGEYEDTTTSFLGHFADRDAFDSADNIDSLRERLQAGDGSVTFHMYPDTEYWFFESDRPEFNEDAVRLAWSRTTEFLRSEL